MKVDAFDFELPAQCIALRPAFPRDSARLLAVRVDGFDDLRVTDLPGQLRPGDALVFNDTRVIPAELSGRRSRDGQSVAIHANLHKRAGDDRWWAFAKPGKRLRIGDRVRFGGEGATCSLGVLDARVIEKGEGGQVLFAFDLSGPDLDIAIASVGNMPLPAYIAGKRPADAQDFTDYQTVFARLEGSVAAPTAGLHFTPELLQALQERGISLHFVTLHVGAGTFLPVKVDDTADHVMHAEYGEVSEETAAALNAVRAAGGRIVSVGTTSARLLESAADEVGRLHPFAAETAIFMTPGYRFKCVDGLMTNFHLPRSTLFMLVSAFAGMARMRAAYEHAIASGYRFYSYGDASLLWREG